MIGKLYLYFGVIGIASILAWLVALALFAGFCRSRQRTARYWMALGLAVAGLLFANINSHFVGAIEVDRSEEQAKAIERQKELRRQLEQEQEKKAARVRYVEDTPTDVLDMAGVSTTSTDKYEQAAAVEDVSKYTYRQRGKQQRVVSTAAATNEVVAGTVAVEVKSRLARQLPERDVMNANRLDRINLFCARFCFWMAWLLVGWDYLTRFNRTFGHLYPLPVAHRAIDAAWPKRHTVWAPSVPAGAIIAYLEGVVRKGENFIYLGDEDPWPEAQALPKLAFLNWAWWPRWKITLGEGRKAYDNEFVFESVWFHRYAFVVVGAVEGGRRVAGLAEFLQQRQRSHASARKTVHVVWACRGTPPPELAMVARLCREANFKLVVAGAMLPGVQFEETIAVAVN